MLKFLILGYRYRKLDVLIRMSKIECPIRRQQPRQKSNTTRVR